MRTAGVTRLVYSSSAAVYGEPRRVPIAEADRTEPINPYGATKLAFEGAMRWFAAGHDFRAISLRYFNVAGATERNGEDHRPETHLIPLVLRVARGEASHVQIFGQDYPTPDGTCIRDFVHVRDLAAAHLLALEATGEGDPSLEVYNLGSAAGFSVREVVEAARKVTGRAIPARVLKRRSGDPPVLVASSRRARRELGWHPQHSKLEEMLSDAWAWRQAHTDGYHDGGRRSGDSRASKNGEMTRTAAAEAMAEERVAQPAAQAAHRP
jgi:UDP-glucose 4-epimerase